MKDFLLNAEDKAFRAEVREFMIRVLEPASYKIEADESWLDVMRVVDQLGDTGYMKVMFPDLYDGPLTAPGLAHAAILSEEAAYLNYGFETTIATAISCAYPLHQFAKDSVKARYLKPILEGKALGSICMTEPGIGSDTAGMETTITRDAASGDYLISGHKRYISNASKSDCYIVWGISDSDVVAQKGMSAVVVPCDAPGIGFPETYNFMGRRGCVVGEVTFDNVRVSAEHLLGAESQGFRIMLKAFNFERVILGGSGIGVARSAFDIAVAHAQSRKAFGGYLGEKQLIWDMIAEMSWRIDAAELLTHRAAKMYDSGIDGKDLMREAAQAKLVATQTANFCADKTVQILGGDGLTKQFGRAEQIYRDARALLLVGGSSEMVKYLIAARDLPDIKPNL
jgi:alkylation response protein AidB-like acyl-CoA dehydrogenase